MQPYPRRAAVCLDHISRKGQAAGKTTKIIRRRGPLVSYLIRRFFLMVLTLFGMSVLIFLLLRVVPGNIVDILFESAGLIDPADKAKIEAELGLDKPLAVAYAHWIGG